MDNTRQSKATRQWLIEKFGKAIADRVSSRKYEGNDQFSYAIFVDDKPFVTGLTLSEVRYFSYRACVELRDKEK